MSPTDIATIDFETEAVDDRPNYPPPPVGVAINYPDGSSRYFSWGHPSGNNCTEAEAKRTVLNLQMVCQTVYHNAKFDLEVAQKWHGYMPPPEMWHDTMILAFLDNPHSTTLALKPLSADLLKLPPTERDEVRDWVLNNVEGARRKPSQWGAHISKAPGELVGKYAVGDVVRTKALFDLLMGKVNAAGMAAAYLREKKLIPILIRNEQEGIRCDTENLTAHVEVCEDSFKRIDTWIGEYLGVSGLNLDENESLADALQAAGKVTEWEKTEKGMRSTAKPALQRMLKDRLLYAALMYRGSMATCLRTFMHPWLDLSAKNGGRLYTTWNTTKQEEGGGTRTGRLSSSKPLNLQNIPNDFSEKFGDLFAETGLLDTLGLCELPTMRNYIVADTPEHVLLGRDFSSQEPRTFAHFEGGWLKEQYIKNPKMDVYRALMARTLEQTSIDMTRKQAKTCIAEGELVLTHVGLVPIELVTTQHRVWDGVDFVSHTGVIFQGIKEVITYDGLTATPDHEVWSSATGRKIPFGEAASKLEKLVRTGHAGAAIRLLDPDVLGDSAEGSAPLLVGQVRLRAGTVGVVGKLNPRAVEPLPLVQQQEGGAFQGAWRSLRRHCSSLQERVQSSIQALRWAWSGVPLQLAGGVRIVGRGEPAAQGLRGGGDRQGGQQRALRAGEFAPSVASRANVQHAQQQYSRILWNTCLRYPHVAPIEDGLPEHESGAGKDGEALTERAAVAGNCGATGTKKRWAKVYDITNAGPRRRFTVSNALVSNCFLGLLYGMGKDKLATQLDTTPMEAQSIKSALMTAIPSIKLLADFVKMELSAGSHVETWGGRRYKVEPEKTIDGMRRTFEYKGLNVLVQGSAADETKEALIRYDEAKGNSRLLLQVHDELVICAPRQDAAREMKILRECMEGLELKVPLLSEGESGYRWGMMEEYADEQEG